MARRACWGCTPPADDLDVKMGDSALEEGILRSGRRGEGQGQEVCPYHPIATQLQCLNASLTQT